MIPTKLKIESNLWGFIRNLLGTNSEDSLKWHNMTQLVLSSSNVAESMETITGDYRGQKAYGLLVNSPSLDWIKVEGYKLKKEFDLVGIKTNYPLEKLILFGHLSSKKKGEISILDSFIPYAKNDRFSREEKVVGYYGNFINAPNEIQEAYCLKIDLSKEIEMMQIQQISNDSQKNQRTTFA